jgi:hypothetical protein
VRIELGHQCRVVVEAHGMRQRRPLFRVDRHRVSLRVVAILQAVFEFAQKTIGLRELHAHGRRDQAVRRGVPQHGERRPHAETRILTATNQLKHLRAEFDLTNAAAAELDVVGLVRPHRCAALRLLADLQMQRADRADHAEVEIAAVDERRDDRIELLRHPARRVAAAFGHQPPLDPGVAFPLTALHVKILFEHAKTTHERPRIAVRPQPHVDAEHVAVGGHFGKRRDQTFAKPGKKILRRNRRTLTAGGLTVFFINEDQIDIRRDVQLPSTQLAHADHAERQAFALWAARLAVQHFEIGRQHRQRPLDGRFSQIGHRAGHFGDVRTAGQVALHHGAKHLGAQLAQRPLEAVLGQRNTWAASTTGLRRAQFIEAGLDPLARQRLRRQRRDTLSEFRTCRQRARRIV